MMRDVFCVLGLPFHCIGLNSAVENINQAALSRNHCFLTTPNLNFLISAQEDNEFFKSVVDSDLIIADGMPIIWVARLLGIPFSERVAGSDLFDVLSKRKTEKKIKVFFFGGQKGIAELACQILNQSSDGMSCCGFYDPGFVSVDEMSSPEILDRINACEPDFIVVALGAKKGQKWIQKNRRYLSAPVISHLGAVINFVAGNIERAPVFWRNCGLEWLWRIGQEPALWKRYFFDGIAFIKLLLFNVIPLFIYDRLLRSSRFYRYPVEIEQLENSGAFHLSGSLHVKTLQSIKELLSECLANPKQDVYLDCSKISYVDSGFIGYLLLFQSKLNEEGGHLILKNLPNRIRRIFHWNLVLKRFTIH